MRLFLCLTIDCRYNSFFLCDLGGISLRSLWSKAFAFALAPVVTPLSKLQLG